MSTRTLLFTAVLTFVLITLFVIVSHFIPFDKGSVYYPVLDGSNVPIGEIKGTMKVGQTFVADYDNLDRIDVLFATYARQNTHEIIFHLREISTSKDITTIKISANDIQDNVMHLFRFNPINDSKGKQYYFFIESPSSVDGNAVTVWILKNSNYNQGQLVLDDNSTTGDIVFKPYFKTNLKEYTDILLARILLNKPSFFSESFLYVIIAFYLFFMFILMILLFQLLHKSKLDLS